MSRFLRPPGFALLWVLAVTCAAGAPLRERTSLNAGWRFAFGHPFDTAKDFNYGTGYFSDLAKAGYGDGPAAAKFDDRAWRVLDLPHDWAVEAAFDPRGSFSHGFKAVGRNFPDRSVGWYRRHFSIPAGAVGRRFRVEFEGAFRSTDVWINGFHLGRHDSGYTGFAYDLTEYLNYGGENVLSARVDATREEGWYYEGAGIYRNVWLVETSALHLEAGLTAVTTEPAGGAARVNARFHLTNDGNQLVPYRLEPRVYNPDGRLVATAEPALGQLAPGESVEISRHLNVSHPRLWSLTTPVLYRCQAVVSSDGRPVDQAETSFGIRTILFDPDRGFFLNGEHIELKGSNNHQDFAGVGVAVPDALQEYRVRQLQAFGINAWRCSHNPPSPALLEACDRLGLFVIDENRAFGAETEQLDQLASMIERDRNHPCVILWSLGNEEWAVEGNVTGARLIQRMQVAARRLDPRRRTTYANSGGWGGISTVADVVGYNYIHQSNPDEQHAKFPFQPGVGTEETTTQGTRGIYFDDRDHQHLGPQQHGDSGENSEVGWKYYAARPFLSGLFFWTGFDYRGEPTPFGWPAISSQFGLLDTCGFPKDSAYYVQAWWSQEHVLHLFPHWNWAGHEGQPIPVTAFTNDDEAELALNGRSLGRQTVPRNGHVGWTVPYAPGRLELRGYRGGQLDGTTVRETTGAAARLDLSGERSGLPGAAEPVAVFTISARDAAGRPVPTADNHVGLHVTGGRILGVGNGDPSCLEPDCFVPDVGLVTLKNWRGRIAAPAAAAPADESGSGFGPMPELGRWRAPLPQGDQVYELAASFDATPDAGASYHLYLPAFGPKMSVWLNGRPLGELSGSGDVGPDLALKAADLASGRNRLQLRVTPFNDGRDHIPELAEAGVLQVARPAPAASRSLFNGLARVIVLPEAGATVHLEATAPGLSPASADLTP